ncbi:MAG: hypothetical protein IKQ91_05920 [Oscillospiraceae bacterium]|nr:hypothetical protein [Oscillospiraceae bacterium]
MKRICSLLCAAVFGLSGTAAVFPAEVTAFAENELVFQGMKYEIADGAVTITGNTQDLPEVVVIPAEIGGLPVTGIGESAFWCCSLTKITIPDAVLFARYLAEEGDAASKTPMPDLDGDGLLTLLNLIKILRMLPVI